MTAENLNSTSSRVLIVSSAVDHGCDFNFRECCIVLWMHSLVASLQLPIAERMTQESLNPTSREIGACCAGINQQTTLLAPRLVSKGELDLQPSKTNTFQVASRLKPGIELNLHFATAESMTRESPTSTPSRVLVLISLQISPHSNRRTSWKWVWGIDPLEEIPHGQEGELFIANLGSWVRLWKLQLIIRESITLNNLDLTPERENEPEMPNKERLDWQFLGIRGKRGFDLNKFQPRCALCRLVTHNLKVE